MALHRKIHLEALDHPDKDGPSDFNCSARATRASLPRTSRNNGREKNAARKQLPQAARNYSARRLFGALVSR
jgi:hypothetical protein